MMPSNSSRWRAIIAVVSVAALAVMLVCATVVGMTGLHKPVIAGIGLLLTIAVNRIYVVVERSGDVLEGIDVAEAPLVALALLLPASEAVLVFALGSALLELPLERAAVKKMLNVGVRVTGAAVLVAPVLAVRHELSSLPAIYAAAAGGAALYALFTLLVVASVVANVAGERLRTHLPKSLGPRVLVWSTAVAIGIGAAYVVPRSPMLLLCLLAPLALMARMATVARRTQQDAERLHLVIEANSRILATPSVEEQENVLLAAAQSLLLWRDVFIRDTPPGPHEHGALLSHDDCTPRWLVAAPRPDSDPWSGDDTRILEVLAARASVALDRARMQSSLAEQAMLDPLTDVANRRRLELALAEMCDRPEQRVAVIAVDLDGFKTVNDRLGHDAGDDLLRVAARRLAGSVRAGDLVARTGGDEFIVLLHDVPSQEAAERVSRHISDRFAEPVHVGRWQLPRIPMSIGLAVAPAAGSDPRSLMRAADEAMYVTKRQHAGTARDINLSDIPLQLTGERAAAVHSNG